MIKEYYDKQKEAAEGQQGLLEDKKEILKPGITQKPTYTAKAPKK